MKKIFRLSAMVAMVSMMATSVCVSSCSDDDDDDDSTEIVNKDKTETFTLTVGGSKAKAGSFISIQNKAVYTSSEVTADSGVEIVFDGKKFVGAQTSINPDVASTGLNAQFTVVEQNKEYNYTTNGADFGGKSYSGTIKVTKGEMGSDESQITITVTRK